MIPQNQEDDKSALRKYAEYKAKQKGKKVARKLAKKGAKIAVELAKIAAKQFAIALGKLLVWIVSTVGLPVLVIALCSVIALVFVSLAWSFLLGTGEGLTGNDKKTHEYIVEQTYKTVNMNSSIERPYRVPEKLVAATIQLDAFQKNDDIKEIIKKMAKSLSPTFDYGQYDEWKEKQVTVCEDGKCNKGEIIHTKNMVTKIDNVEYWNGSTTFKYTPHVTDWIRTKVITYKTIKVPVQKTVTEKVQVPDTNKVCEQELIRMYPYPIFKEVCKDVTTYKTVTKTKTVTVIEDKKIEIQTLTATRKQYFTSTKTTTTDYATFDSILNSYGLGLNDKKLIEANYLFMGGTIAYTDWLKTMGGGDLGFGVGFDGSITPGGGVPPQFMPFYRTAEKKYGVHWYVLAAIHFVETGFSTHPTMISSAGAIGHLQVRP